MNQINFYQQSEEDDSSSWLSGLRAVRLGEASDLMVRTDAN